jgi:hypothetical protein
MKRLRLYGSRRAIWLEADRGAGLPDRLTTSETLWPPMPTQSGSLEPNVELFRGRIQLGNGERRVSAYLFDHPNDMIEIHAEHGCGAMTITEGKALSEWLHQKVVERSPKPAGWFRRLLQRGR